MRDELTRLRSELARLEQHSRQLAVLAEDQQHVHERVAHLERILDFDRVAAHAEAAIARAALVESSVAHLRVANLLPRDVYDLLRDLIPDAAFFESGGGSDLELRVPPRIARVDSIVAWTFMTELVLRRLAPALVRRFADPLARLAAERFRSLPPMDTWDVEVTLSEGRLVRRCSDDAAVADGAWSEWDWLTTMVWFEDAENERANSTVTWVTGSFSARGESLAGAAAGRSHGVVYEFGIGPTREGRRRLSKMLSYTG